MDDTNFNLTSAIQLVEGAGSSQDSITRFFGTEPSNKYREFAKLLHPDKLPPRTRYKIRAIQAFEKLTEMYAKLSGKTPIPSATMIGGWVVTEPFCSGDIADLYHCTDKSTDKLIFKIARETGDNDLIEAEYAHLKMLAGKDGFEQFGRYMPKIVGGLEASGRRANILTNGTEIDGLSLASIIEMFPTGLDFRHIIWMGNRALSALGFAHRYGVIHGAVIPEHLIYGPASHGLYLIDWCYSIHTESKDHIKALVDKRASLYPPEVGRKFAACPQTDIYMLMNCLRSAAGYKIPKRFAGLFDHCLVMSPKSRPADAWNVLDKWKTLAEQEYGAARYIKLEIPTN